MKRRTVLIALLVAAVVVPQAALAGRPAGEVRLVPADPPNLTASTGGGEVAGPNGKIIRFAKATLTFDPPEVLDKTVMAKAPRNHASWYDPWQPWPKKGRDKKFNTIELKPSRDEERTPILGGLYRSVLKDSVVVTSADGAKTFKMGVDYKYNDDWGQIANLKGGLGAEHQAELKVGYRLALQRLDLVQVGADGKVTVKKGTSRIVCPQLPEPDAGAVALAGVYIAPWLAARNPWFDESGGLKAATKFAITEHEICLIRPAAPVKPINVEAVAGTWQKLRDGKEARIAFMGASITLGAETPAWWANLWTARNLGYPSRVIVELRRRFPKATVTPIEAFKGGTTTKYGLKMIDEKVVPAKADLLLLAFGGNDVAGPEGKPPRNPPEQFKEDMRALVRKAKAKGMEVILVVTMQQTPGSRRPSGGRHIARR